MTIEKGQLEQKALSQDTKKIHFGETDAVDNVGSAGLTAPILTARLELASTTTQKTSIVFNQDTKNHQKRLHAIDSGSHSTTTSGIPESGATGQIWRIF